MTSEVRSYEELGLMWKEYLRVKGLNTTQQRDCIVESFLRTTGHVSVDDLLLRVKKQNPKIGYATVYRTLKLLAESGIADARQFKDGQTVYEIKGAHHDHLICTECGLIVEFEDDEIEVMQDNIAKLHKFVLTSHRHELYGLCETCQSKNGGQR